MASSVLVAVRVVDIIAFGFESFAKEFRICAGVAYPVVAGVLLHGLVKWPPALHIEVGSHPSKRKFLRKLKMTVDIRIEHQNVVIEGIVGFPPGLKAGIPSL
ncbi:hypothetical protein [Halosimplex amylolyticum]|uniref:hypothetical protein n=1 Tax=Halosimplex amylolyticum TaxID=3396616 RepID=UPI003F57B70F